MATLAPALEPEFPAHPSNVSLARLRVELCYLWRHGRKLDLARAPRFTEMVQRRKLFDRDPRHVGLMDKLAAKSRARALLGDAWITPTLWAAEALPHRPNLPRRSIVKARHGCNQYAVLHAPPNALEWAELATRTARWTAAPYGGWLDEWAYRDVPRGVLAEPLIGDGDLPIDYKIYVFGGHATHVQVHYDRARSHRWVLHDRDFRPLAGEASGLPAPRSLIAMLAAAEELAAGFDFLRVDFYDDDGAPRFGEFCLYPGSGLDPFAADWIDLELGSLWHQAQSVSDASPVRRSAPAATGARRAAHRDRRGRAGTLAG